MSVATLLASTDRPGRSGLAPNLKSLSLITYLRITAASIIVRAEIGLNIA